MYYKIIEAEKNNVLENIANKYETGESSCFEENMKDWEFETPEDVAMFIAEGENILEEYTEEEQNEICEPLLTIFHEIQEKIGNEEELSFNDIYNLL